jgi:hypothetical protein
VPPSRAGLKTVCGHFEPEVSKRLRQLALDQEKTIQALLTESLNLLFQKYKKPPIA